MQQMASGNCKPSTLAEIDQKIKTLLKQLESLLQKEQDLSERVKEQEQKQAEIMLNLQKVLGNLYEMAQAILRL